MHSWVFFLSPIATGMSAPPRPVFFPEVAHAHRLPVSARTSRHDYKVYSFRNVFVWFFCNQPVRLKMQKVRASLGATILVPTNLINPGLFSLSFIFRNSFVWQSLWTQQFFHKVWPIIWDECIETASKLRTCSDSSCDTCFCRYWISFVLSTVADIRFVHSHLFD